MIADPAPDAEKSRRIVLIVSCYIMATGSAMFVVLTSSALTGVVVAPMALGFVADALSLRWAMGLMAVPALLWMVALLQSVRIMDGKRS